ncbi:MAG: AAA family ATPase [Chloroflexi bacterium]|nr:AAA family ATPase [Chloroflexota bacterium]
MIWIDGEGPAVRVRIGVNTGEAVTGSAGSAQFLVTGPAVNLAARLQQAAAPGEIVVGDLTKRLTAGGVDYGAAREIDAKGIGRIAVHPAERILTETPEQHRGLPGLRAPLIGRDHEMRTLVQAHAGLVRSERPHLVTIYGPAGSGKSRLTKELLDVIGHERARSGRCLPYGEGISYYPVQLILREDAGIGISEPRDSAIEKLRAAAVTAFAGDLEEAEGVARRVSVLAGLRRSDEALPEVQPTELRDELTLGLQRYLERRSAGSPLVLIFEDIHWAEPGLLDLIEGLAEWARAPLLLLCLARPDFREVRPTWGSAAANATAISLSPLNADDTRRLIAELLAIDDLSEQVRSDVISRAEGNPLYVEEFLRMLMETGRIEKRDGRWIANASMASVEIPPTLQGLITARLDRVEPEVKALLQRASLAGRLFSTDALTALAEGAKPDPSLLRDAIRRDLLVEADERALGSGRVFRFKHVLIRDVAYSTVPKAERSRLHDRYGRWLETSLGDRRHEIADIIAFHAEQAFLLARELGGSSSAGLSRRALDLLLSAGRSAHDRADAHAAANLYTRAKVVADVIGATPLEVAEIAGRIALSRDELQTERVSREDLMRAIDLARAAAPNPVLPELLIRSLTFERQADDDEGARATIEEALATARAAGDPEQIAEALFQRAFQRYWINDIDAMYALLLEGQEFVRSANVKRGGYILYWLGKAAIYRGDLAAYARFVEEAIAALPKGSKFYRAIGMWGSAGHAMDIGDPERALPDAEQARDLFREMGRPGFIASAGWTMAEALLELGDPARAREVLSEAVDLFVRRGQRGQIPEVRARLARALVMLGDLPAAREQAEAALAVVLRTDVESRFISEVAMGEVLDAEGDVAAAEARFREAIAILEPSGLGNVLAVAREHYARFLLHRGRGDEARAQLEKARAFWHDPLADRHRKRIDALLAQTTAVKA